MNDSELKNAVKKYKRLTKISENIKVANEKLKELEKTPKISEYLELLKVDKKAARKMEKDQDIIDYLDICKTGKMAINTKYKEDTMLSRVIGNIASKTQDSYQIYVYMGSFTKDNKFTKDINNFSYNVYFDIETTEPIEIKKSKVKDFEKEYKILYMPGSETLETEKKYLSMFWNFRHQYLEKMLLDYMENTSEMKK